MQYDPSTSLHEPSYDWMDDAGRIIKAAAIYFMVFAGGWFLGRVTEALARGIG